MKTKLLPALICLIMGMSLPSLLAADKAATPKLPPFVKATGVGKDKEEALKNAFREAVRIAVGTVIDSEIIIKNDKVIKDQIIDYSRGFVESHKVLSKGKNKGGLYEVTIRATVKDRQLYEKLRRFQPASAKVEGSNIFGAVTSRMESRKKAAKLLAKSLAATDLPLPLLKTEFLSKKPKILEENAESILAEWQVRVSFDQKLYQEKVYPWLRELLGDVATDKKLGLVPKRYAVRYPFGELPISGSDVSVYSYFLRESSVPKDWLARDQLIYLWNKGEYDVFWVPSEVAVELVKSAEAARKKVSGLIFELKGEKQNVLLKKELFFSGPGLYSGDLQDGRPAHRGSPILPPMFFYHEYKNRAEIIPAFLFFKWMYNEEQIQSMKDHIIVPWRIRVPLETINKTKDVNCRIAP